LEVHVAQPSNPEPLKQIVWKALWRALCIVPVTLILGFVSVQQLGVISSLVKAERDVLFDALTRTVQHMTAPTPPPDVRPVILVDIDEASINGLSPSGHVFHRGQLAKLLTKIADHTPRGVFVDLDLRQPSNENGVLSVGDQELLMALGKLSYPLLLANGLLLGQPRTTTNANLVPVNVAALYEEDVTRRIPHPMLVPTAKTVEFPAAVAMYCIGQRLDLRKPQAVQTCRQQTHLSGIAGSGELGSRIGFRELRRFAEGVVGSQFWPGLHVISALDFAKERLAVSPETRDALWVVGRSYPLASDQHLTPIGPLAGVDVHVNALMTLVTYSHFADDTNGLLLIVVAMVSVFVGLLTTFLFSEWLMVWVERRWAWTSIVREPVHSFIEAGLTVTLMFVVGVFVLRYRGYFLDYVLPVLSFHLMLWCAERLKGVSWRGTTQKASG
jgi:CHASE2 domain-containing sensor protein